METVVHKTCLWAENLKSKYGIVRFNAGSTHYRLFQARSSQPIVWCKNGV